MNADEVGVLRFCPACARPAKGSDYVGDAVIICVCCERPWEACPCTPLVTIDAPCKAEVPE